jgi:hypothetical protein
MDSKLHSPGEGPALSFGEEPALSFKLHKNVPISYKSGGGGAYVRKTSDASVLTIIGRD